MNQCTPKARAECGGRKLTKMNAFQKELLNSILLLALGGWIWWYAGKFPDLPEGHPGPSLFPRIIGIGLILSGALLLVTNLRRRRGQMEGTAEESIDPRGILRLALGIGLVILYPFLRNWMAFIPSLLPVCFLVALLLRAKVWVAALTALGTVLFIHLIFTSLLGLSL
jgi:putative tricarboxylic transport membrane protein